MAKATAGQGNPIDALVKYLQNTRSELRKVIWPEPDEAVNLTAVVLAITIAMTALMGVLDFLFGRVLEWILALA